MGARRVLVIEDETSAREALESLLLEEGYVVRTASTGLDGLECYQAFRPDAVVCDYYLPDIDGLQVLRRIRAGDDHVVRFIMVTAGLSGAANERALRREADAFLGKPVNLADLSRILRSNDRDRSTDGGTFLNATR
jgi:DNA-binding response OmpR family regulator